MVWEIVVLILAVPVGFLLSWMARDELVQGRKWFVALIALSLIFCMVFFAIGDKTIQFALAFISIVSLISYIKSFDKNWTK